HVEEREDDPPPVLGVAAVNVAPLGARHVDRARVERVERIEERTDAAWILVAQRLAFDESVDDDPRGARHPLEGRERDRQGPREGRDEDSLLRKLLDAELCARNAQHPLAVEDKNLEVPAVIVLDKAWPHLKDATLRRGVGRKLFIVAVLAALAVTT